MFNLRHLRLSPPFTSAASAASAASAYLTFHENLKLHLTKGHLDEALTLFFTSSFPHTHQTYADLLHACARHGRLSDGQALHRHLLNTHNPNNPPNIYVNNHLINMYAKCGSLDHARKVFDEMPERNVVSWTALISGYSQHGRCREGCGVFSEMLTEFRPNEFAYASVLTGCDRGFGRQVHGHALKTCFDAVAFVGNALIGMYSKKNDDDEGMDHAWMVFESLKVRNLVTWNSMIDGFRSRGKWKESAGLFSTMRHDREVGFDRATLLCVLSSLLTVNDGGGDHVIGERRKYCFQVHCLAAKTWFASEIEVITTLIKAYANLGVEISDLYRLFTETRGRRDIVSWTAFITVFAERVPEESLRFFSELRRDGLVPDRHTYSIVLKACAGLVTNRPTLAVHSQIVKFGYDNDTVLANALIHAYGRSGSLPKSEKVFESIPIKDIVSWNSMIKIYGLHGQPRNALKRFAEMNVSPDATTFVAVLSACSHAGLVEEGTEIFETMSKTYGIVRQLDHYACMVDILARSGRILDAQKLVNEMPMKPDSVIWSSMLAACRKHGETNLAELAAAKLQDLDPKNSLGYVIMSNIHCSAGTFGESVDIRNRMEGSGVKKDPGLSWTEVGTQVHEFAAGGLHHSDRDVVYADLEVLIKELKRLGYVPETNLAMRDVEEEDKDRELNHHSEKLAFVFALKHGKTRPFGAIRIVKNIRICVDCHNFMKFASEFVGREIVVRDSNRFHHFKERVCSCNDYW
ncbi:hypothetical protein OSB04_004884 [Centaurea solstitialis]|uniref:DYW domain-containing protein n=1 Tax=Centaurea solstitialis TaxID=347529 RepID=A0AA38TEZ2_9ASTR|nr:hypothetical protein OSB04_004884 [Centaurea solstitialis]